ncbi:hypothetical protein MMC07_006872 [Pseudocyphellaria aurata]|nr:hypothetical protein [Pseudocyphellaria aurata]
MEFLYPPESDQNQNHVILLLVVAKSKRSKLFCYEWDCSTSLTTAALKGPGQGLHAEDQLPLLLVPLRKSTAFMLVTEKRLTIYRDILTGPAHAHVHFLSLQEPPEEPGISKNLPIWTQWARPMRNKAHSKLEDNIYLCREDGVVSFLEIKDQMGSMLDTTHKAGFLGVNINTSFAAIDVGFKAKTDIEHEPKDVSSVDMLIGGGDMSDGGRWSFGAREVAQRFDIIPNWTPLMDLTATDGPNPIRRSDQGQTRFFASTGRGSRHGRITEIRYGIEAVRKSHLSELQELAQIGITQLWVLNEADGGILVLLSYPTHTSLCIWGADEALDPMDGTDYEIAYDTMTIAAGMSAEDLIVQVTGNCVRASKSGMEAFNLEATILAACVRRNENERSQVNVLVAVRSQDGVHLRLGYFGTADQEILYHPIGGPVKLTSEPVYVSLELIGDDYFVIVGTLESTLQVFRVSPRADMIPAFEYNLDGEFAVCDSLAVLTMQSPSDIEHLLVCGLRNGATEVLRFNLKSPEDDLLSFCERLQIGSTTVTVAADNTRISRAIILCEQRLLCLEYPVDDFAKAQIPASLNNIWLTDTSLSELQQGKITTITQALSGFAQGLLFCVERSQIHMARISESSEPRMVPRHIHINGTPIRVLYSQLLKKLVVLFYQIGITHATQRNGIRVTPNLRSLKYKVMIVDPDVGSINPDLDQSNEINAKSVFEGKPGERFLGVSEWFPSDGKGLHHMLVVHTMVERPTPSESQGRILFFSATESGILSLKREYDAGSPVYALASYGHSSLVYSCGNNLCLFRVEFWEEESSGQASGRILQPIKCSLGTRGLHISTHEPLVYVTTDQNGLMVFRVEETKLVPHLNDANARDGFHHLTIPELSLTITSQKTCTIAGLWEPPKRRVDGSASTVFEAALPGSITRFRRIRRPPWQKSLRLDGSSAATSDPILGTSTNGAIYQFDILDESSRSLLRFIQNMALLDRVICPFRNDFAPRPRHLDPCVAREKNLHVDGDIIRRLLDRDAELTLQSMLERAPLPANRRGEEFDFDSAVSRQKRFAELARAAGVVDWESGEELMTAVISWIRFRLQIAL